MSFDTDKPELIVVANCLRIVSHPSRLAIALLLLNGPCAVSEIEATLSLRQPNLSQHLGILRDANLLNATRQAKSVVYELADGLPHELVRALNAAISGVLSSGNRPADTGANASLNAKAPVASRTVMDMGQEAKNSAAAQATEGASKSAGTDASRLRATSAESDDSLLFAHILQRRTDA